MVQVMPCRLLVAKPLPEPVKTYYKLYEVEWNSESKYNNFHSTKYILNGIYKCQPPCSRLDFAVSRSVLVLVISTFLKDTSLALGNRAIVIVSWTLQWRHNGHYRVSNHQPQDCFLNRLFRRKSKETWKFRVAGLCEGNSPGIGEFP